MQQTEEEAAACITLNSLLPLHPPCPPAASSFRQQQERGGVLDLPAGASSLPLHLPAGLPSHTLSFRCVPPAAYAAVAAADSLPLWSRPLTVRVGQETQMHVVVPVIPSEDEEAQKGEGGSGDAAHLTATKATTARGGWPPAVAILRLSVHRRGLGAMHVVLESMHCDPPYLLENRTRFPLQYRQVGGRWHTQHPAGCLPDGTRDCREQRLPTIQLRDCLSSARLPFCRPMCGLRPSTLSNPSAQVLCCAVLPLHRLVF